MIVEGVDITFILICLIAGIIAGAIWQLIDQGKVKGGLLMTALLGIVGAVIAGIAANMYFGMRPLTVDGKSTLFVFTGAVIFALLYRVFMRDDSFVKTTTRGKDDYAS